MRELLTLTLLNAPKIGRKTAQRLLAEIHGAPEGLELLERIESLAGVVSRLRVPSQEELGEARSRAERALSECARLGIEVLTPYSERFPKRLLAVEDAPIILFVRGTLDGIESLPAVAIVGTREPSSRGEKGGERLGEVLAGEGFAVVSGLALGCDAAAHRGCLKAGGRTVAFMAHGLDTVYPSQNKVLGAQVIANGGALVSEYAPGTASLRGHFLERDRLQSAMSEAVIVVETGLKGGTMQTVEFARQQGRLLACLAPAHGDVSDQTAGVRKLLEEGSAVPLGSPEDIAALVRGVRERYTTNKALTPIEVTGSVEQLPLFGH